MGREDRASIKILEVMAREGRPLTWKELVEKTGLAKATVTHALKRLRRSNLVRPQLVEDVRIGWTISEKLQLRCDIFSSMISDIQKRLEKALCAIIDRKLPREETIIKMSLKESLGEEELAKLAKKLSSDISKSFREELEKTLLDVMKEIKTKLREEE